MIKMLLMTTNKKKRLYDCWDLKKKKKLVTPQCPSIYKNITKTMDIIYPTTFFDQIEDNKKNFKFI